ncbi:carboxymuconolactone decarboxylase family protein [Microvirga sp. Mcv34]|uniref:carboxymuconolactone decarboxylase family protein n=1 Tax=Microvirga sp. Mcv34 TaxID=2926016 RepID=UPI0021C938E9|nr:carboxymuconolactone decarboxylase family protein [Microvirga sp. Mcv34]
MKTVANEGSRIYAELRGEDNAQRMECLSQTAGAEAIIAELSLDFVFGKIWARDRLDRKQRSLVTIGVLIALRQTSELEKHLQVGLTNGLSRAELEEAIVQTAPYAGFPAAWSAANVLSSLSQGSDIEDQL